MVVCIFLWGLTYVHVSDGPSCSGSSLSVGLQKDVLCRNTVNTLVMYGCLDPQAYFPNGKINFLSLFFFILLPQMVSLLSRTATAFNRHKHTNLSKTLCPLLSFPTRSCSTGSRDSSVPSICDEAWWCMRYQDLRDQPGCCSLSLSHLWPKHQTVQERKIWRVR